MVQQVAAKRPYLFTVEGLKLKPFDVDTEMRLQDFQQGQLLRCTSLTRPRSLPFQGHYWATLTNIVDATECAATVDHLHDFLVKACGYTSIICDVKGMPMDVVRDSTAFDAMDENEFQKYVNAAQRVLAERIGLDWADFTKPIDRNAA